MKTRLNYMRSALLMIIVMVCVSLTIPAWAEKPAHEFIGTKKCSMCHKSKKAGEQLALWEKSKHATAFTTLATDKGKEFATKAGVTDPQTSGKCLSCHATSHYFTEEKVTDKVAPEEGVSCESCHGPGADYKSMKVMKDHDAAVAKGLVIPDEKLCGKCHNDSGSHPQNPFDYAERSAKIAHPKP